jgi:hypothetical protein
MADYDATYPHDGEAKDDAAYCHGSVAKDNAGAIPTMSLAPEEAPWLWQMPWLSLQGWVPSFIGKEKVVATMVVVISSTWRQQDWAVDSSQRASGGSRRMQ